MSEIKERHEVLQSAFKIQCEEMLLVSAFVAKCLCFLAVLQIVNDITTFYQQTYNNFETTGDERLKETLRAIHTGVSDIRSISSLL